MARTPLSEASAVAQRRICALLDGSAGGPRVVPDEVASELAKAIVGEIVELINAAAPASKAS